MSISVKNISKVYGDQYALRNVSLEIPKGQIIGFLGPNGAGKSTLMKIITCFIPQTEGEIKVCNLDVNEQTLGVKKRVGYLPEHTPLYQDMYVKEYLSFIAHLHQVPKRKERVDEMIESVGLRLESHKKIAALSKGYQQRVGLAQALIHDPEVLILDEPTSGLDPNQLEDIRNLIKRLGSEKTVMLSTHIMQEVEAICDRVIIINKGEIVADDSAKNLQNQTAAKQVIRVEFDQVISIKKLQTISGVSVVNQIDQNLFLLEPKSKVDLRPAISKFANENHLLILTLQKEEQSLEEAFKKLTNK
ncbi:gliding motility-associated ABC transporter ATP-binding subunit GldA [Flavobacteriales bacterium]|nr:gliding motility-associated ABC transporter ATP-binding subunit GldA [Flavobacteriales bacterium]